MLFICTGNSARSQMAEGLLRDLAGDRYEAHSAGTDPKPEVHPLAVVAMREVGLDLSGAAPKDLEQFEGQAFDLVVTVCDHARESCPVFRGAARQEHWGFEDPAAAEGSEEERLSAFRRIRDEIRERLEAWLAQEGSRR